MEATAQNLIYQKIPEIMSKVWSIGKDRKNLSQGYSFRGIDDMYNALNAHLSEAKVFFTPRVIDLLREERKNAKGTVLIYSVLTVEFTAYAEDGSNVKTVTVGEAMDSGDKSMNKAMSTAYKYALMQIFCIPTEEEKDTEYQTHEVAAAPKPTMGDKEFGALVENAEKFKTASEAIKAAKAKYSVPKEMEKKIEDLYTEANSDE